MGIQGLLQFLKEASEPVNVKKYKGQTVAVDTYCWLHKGAFSCADKLAKGEPTDQYVAYCLKLVHMLQSHGVRPILVFDGCTLPSKKDVERTRREKRQLNLQKGKQLLREGKLSEARDCFSRAVNITSEMAHNVITSARSEGVDCIVAPYEADAQLAYLNKNGFAQAVITEDSDLLAFGCKTVILKMDKFGNGLEIDQDRFGLCRHLGDVFTEEKFRYMCILSGCDYLPSIHGIGLVKASKLLKVANNPDITQVIKKMGQYLKSSITVPEDYVRGFIQANNTFLYQMVFDPVRRKLVPLSPYEDGMDPRDLSYAGANIGDSAAYQIAIGNVDVNTMEEIDDYNPDNPQSSRPSGHSWSPPPSLPPHSIWRRHSTSGTQVKTKVESKPKSRGLILPSTRSQVKRPPEGEESDLFRQYSSPQNKKLKMESEEGRSEVRMEGSANHTKDAGVRNRFSLLRKNEKSDSISAPGTRSRFFCKPSDLVSDFVDVKRISNGANMETSETCEISAGAGASSAPQRNPRNCFSWSGRLSTSPLSSPHLSTSPLSSPHLSSPHLSSPHLSSPHLSSGGPGPLSSGGPGPLSSGGPGPLSSGGPGPLSSPHLSTSPLSSPHLSSGGPGPLSSGGPGPLSSGGPGPLSSGGPGPPSPLSSSLLSLRQFQRNKNVLDSNMEDECAPPPTSAVLTSSENTSAKGEMEDSSSEDKTEESPPEISTMASPAPRTVAKVSGLLKPKRLDPRSGSKLRPLVPAKASGLRGRAARNNENQPALQATIRDLWKNFSFKK